MRAFLAFVLAIFCVSCSKADVKQTSSDLKAAASHVKNDPAVKKLGADIKVAAKDTGQELKKGAAKAKVELKKAGADVKSSADKAGHEVKQSAHDAKEKASG
jgi:F0F1-type ATP synthase membrane subunit b/b'